MKKLFLSIFTGLFIMNMPLSALSHSLPSYSISSMYSRSIDIAKKHPTYMVAALAGATALLGGSAYVWYKLQNMSLGDFHTFTLEHEFSDEKTTVELVRPNNVVFNAVSEEEIVQPAIEENKQEKQEVEEIKEGKQEVSSTEDEAEIKTSDKQIAFDGFGSHLSNESQDKYVYGNGLSDSVTGYQSFGSDTESYHTAVSKFEQTSKTVRNSQMSDSQQEQSDSQLEPSLPEDDGTEQSYLSRVKQASARGWQSLIKGTAELFSRNKLSDEIIQINSKTMEAVSGGQKREESGTEDKEQAHSKSYESESDYHSTQEQESFDPAAVEKADDMTEEMAIENIKSLMRYVIDKPTKYRSWRSQFATSLRKKSSLKEVYLSITNEIHEKTITAEAIILFAQDNHKETTGYYKQAIGTQAGLTTMTKELEKIYKQYSAYKK